jgi:glyoxylase I family protein
VIHVIRTETPVMAKNGPIVIQGIDHVVLRVRDVERVQRFYCEVLGCTVEKLQPKIGLTQLRAGRSLIDLVDVAGELGRMGGAAPGREGRNMDHVCLRVERLDGAALRTYLESKAVKPGEIVSRYGAEGDGPSMYLEDPEGNTVELKGPPGSVGS